MMGGSSEVGLSVKKDTYYVTTPVYYVNSAPHLGHLYSTVLVDGLARYHQMLLKRPSRLATGTDEHGLKVHQAAVSCNETPSVFCQRVSKLFQLLASRSDLQEHVFTRTSSAQHKKAVVTFWNRLVDNDLIYLDRYEGWYSLSDEAYYTSDEVVAVKATKHTEELYISISTGSTVTWTAEPTYKFRLSRFREPLLAWLKSNPKAIQPPTRCNEVMRLLEEELSDLSVSRPSSRVPWGIEVPGDSSQIIYVWVDALCNYLTAAGFPEESHNVWFPAALHVVGKDILKFHAVYWPALLMGAKLPLPSQILAHGHWTIDGAKMSKSKGNGVDPFRLLGDYGVDTVRYYLLRDGGNTSDDKDFSEERIIVRYKKEMLGIFGNLLSRLTSKALNPDLVIVPYRNKKDIDSSSQTLWSTLQELQPKYEEFFLNYQSGKALGLVVDMLIAANQFVALNEPWREWSAGDSRVSPTEVISLGLDAVRIAGILLQPVIPTKANQLLNQLNINQEERSAKFAFPGLGWSHTEQKLHQTLLYPILNPSPIGGLFPSFKSNLRNASNELKSR